MPGLSSQHTGPLLPSYTPDSRCSWVLPEVTLDSRITKLRGSCHSSWYNDFKIALRSHKDPSYTLHVLFISLLKVDSGFEEALPFLKLKQLCQITFRTLSGWESSPESEGACCQVSWPEFSLRTHMVKEEIQPLQVVPWCPHTCPNTLNTYRYTYTYKKCFQWVHFFKTFIYFCMYRPACLSVMCLPIDVRRRQWIP